jgi:hypothetical protein
MTLDAYLAGKRVKLDPSKAIGKGGEADVFLLPDGRALKLFKAPDHVDFRGQPHEQRAAEARLALHQRKLREFPKNLPGQVVVPEELATDRSGQRVIGYAMALVRPAEPLYRYGDPSFRRAGVSSAEVVALFRELCTAVTGLHSAGVVIGDFNDLNVLVQSGTRVRMIDADSFQFGQFACNVFTDRFVDPLLCDPALPALQLTRHYDANADWYAFAVLLMTCLLSVGPYGGVYRPKRPSQRVGHAARPLRRITIFRDDVLYPKPAIPFRVLPDELLEYFERVFEKDERGAFPLRLFERLRFTECPRCHVEHARAACPLCDPNAAHRAAEVVRVRGTVTCRRVFETSGVVLCARIQGGKLRVVYHEHGAYRREDGRALFQGKLDATLRFAVSGEITLVARAGEMLLLSPGAQAQRVALDSGSVGPAFDANGRHRYWTRAGRLLRDAPATLGADASEPIGDVLLGQTRIWVGPAFGLGLYRASNLSVAFVFDAERRGVNDSLALPPLAGELLEVTCVLDETRAWLLLALRAHGKTIHRCFVYSRSGELEGRADAEPGDGSWLASLRGKCAAGGKLLCADDAGVARVEVAAGVLKKTREFPDTEPFVNAGTELLAGADGLYAVGPRSIDVLAL